MSHGLIRPEIYEFMDGRMDGWMDGWGSSELSTPNDLPGVYIISCTDVVRVSCHGRGSTAAVPTAVEKFIRLPGSSHETHDARCTMHIGRS